MRMSHWKKRATLREQDGNGVKYSVTDFGSWLLVISLSHQEQKLIGLASRREKICLRSLGATGVA